MKVQHLQASQKKFGLGGSVLSAPLSR